MAALADPWAFVMPPSWISLRRDTRGDVTFNSREQFGSRYSVPIFAALHPFVGSIILGPNQAMTDTFQIVLTRERDEAIRCGEVPAIFRRMNALRLHAILRCKNLFTHPNANLKAIADHFLQCGRVSWSVALLGG
ncbi:hypothetical protein Mal15_20380 [Stieleria maiorica]|uniref:Uncharacterized protein n=1 Tax=Stieleria maiorica TaxID=2795974 RepID=A0A5B9M9V5_9BACT|nr:hypothetical protein Mal15_20380 [Stieleria maiorica]